MKILIWLFFSKFIVKFVYLVKLNLLYNIFEKQKTLVFLIYLFSPSLSYS